VNHYSMYSVIIASVVKRFNRTLKNDIWKLFTLRIEIINESTRWNIRLQRAKASNFRHATLFKFRERRQVLHGKKNSVQINALNKYPIYDLQKFCWRKEKFSLFF